MLKREEAKGPLQNERIDQIIQHIEKEISFLEIWDGAVVYGPEVDDNFLFKLDEIDYKDRVIDAVSTFRANEFCLEESDREAYKTLEVEKMYQESKNGKNISVGYETSIESDMQIHVSIDLQNRAVVQEVVYDGEGKHPIPLFQAQTKEELLNNISGFKWEELMTIDKEEVLEKLDLDTKEEFTM
ncbi:hypothetical protein [Listeria seeligeri]|uniref:hypothetical protein n=1 Tax=Listeria seeligeri TaxID=1640 RepID=UPI001C8C4C93|nr:hypothetical protein [Listeria seeligeri]